MVIVGYGTLNNVPYWIVRNTWGTSWGQSGYVFIKRGTNECGIAVEAGYPTVMWYESTELNTLIIHYFTYFANGLLSTQSKPVNSNKRDNCREQQQKLVLFPP